MKRVMVSCLCLLAALASIGLAEWSPIGPDGGNVLALAIDPQAPATMYVLPYEYPDNPRVFKTTDAGASWLAVGRCNEQYVNCAMVDPFDGNTIYALGRSEAVSRSTDGGASWTSYALPATTVGLAGDPLVEGRIYACGYRYDSFTVAVVSVSTNRGMTWAPVVLDPDTNYASAVACDPTDAGVVYAATAYGQVFKSTDGGLAWSPTGPGIPDLTYLSSITVNPGNPAIIVAGGYGGVYRTADYGANWSQVRTMTGVADVEFSPIGAATGYAIAYDSVRNAVFSTSSDSGATWQVQQSGIAMGKSTGLAASGLGPDRAYVWGASGVFQTADRGAHWSPANSGIRIATISTIAVAGWDSRRVYAEAAGNGVFKSGNGGAAWERCEDFLSCGSICGIGLASGADGDILWALEGSG